MYFRNREGGDGMLPDVGHPVQGYLCADIPQDEAQRVHQDKRGDGNLYRKVFPVADNHGQGHGEKGEEHAVRHPGQRAQDGGGGVHEREAMDNPVYRPYSHKSKGKEFFRSSQKNVRSAGKMGRYTLLYEIIVYFCTGYNA